MSRTGTQLNESRGAEPVQLHADGFTLIDVGFTKTMTRRFDIALDVTNLFDRWYDQSCALPREGARRRADPARTGELISFAA